MIWNRYKENKISPHSFLEINYELESRVPYFESILYRLNFNKLTGKNDLILKVLVVLREFISLLAPIFTFFKGLQGRGFWRLTPLKKNFPNYLLKSIIHNDFRLFLFIQFVSASLLPYIYAYSFIT